MPVHMRAFNKILVRDNLITGAALAMLTIFIWAGMNQPEVEPVWPDVVSGFCFSPMQAGQSPLIRRYPSVSQIDSDLEMLAGKTRSVRTYTVEYSIGKVTELALKHGISVVPGAWIDADAAKTRMEIDKLIRITRTHSNVERVIAGNEVILRGDIPMNQMLAYIDRVREALTVPVSTAEPWHVWLKYPQLARHVDYLAVHMLPYWEGVHVEAAVDYIVERMELLKRAFPDKPIVMAEVGWPSNGRTRQSAVASVSNQATFLRRFIARAQHEGYEYHLMEAFDQPWKRETEGAVGAYWGVWDVHRRAKFPFRKPIVAVPNWYLLAGFSILVAGLLLSLLLSDSPTLTRLGRSFIAMMAYLASTATVWIVYDYSNQYLTVGTVLVGLVMFAGMLGAIVILLTETHEWAEAHWVKHRRRLFAPVALPDKALPRVSIHVPAYNEPAKMLISTLDALARLDYPHYEVLVIDNNTKDPATWRPVADHCAALGPQFRFFHVDPLAGFKAGALNFALQHTSPAAEIVAIIDSDYIVDPLWLKRLAPQFSDPQVALVQAPQDYRDGDANAFKGMCHSEYRGFFSIGMVTRNDRNAIIQHGTMTMVRRRVLEDIGGWGQWCITEDTELGLRIFEHGHQAVYIPQSFGQGLMPDTFGDYQKQRFRWAYGAVQILRRHFRQLIGYQPKGLSKGQRYHFVAGWLPWIADGVNLAFNLGALVWSLAMMVAPNQVAPPLVALSLMPLCVFTFKIGKMIYLYRVRIHATIVQTLAAAIAGYALSHTIARAIWLGLVTRSIHFYRTPKMAPKPGLAKTLVFVRQEIVLLLALVGAAIGINLRLPVADLDLQLWLVVLYVQAIPYLAALLTSLLSGLPNFGLRTLYPKKREIKLQK